MVLSLGNIAAAVAVVEEEEEEVAKLLTEVSLSRATNKFLSAIHLIGMPYRPQLVPIQPKTVHDIFRHKRFSLIIIYCDRQ